MGEASTRSPERRRDARVRPPGRVRVAPSLPGLPLEGRLVDVSARGLRFACASTPPLEGSQVTIEILLEDPANPGGPPRTVLDGSGRVVWVVAGDGGTAQAGVVFKAPVDVRQPFPQVRVF